jgi:nicotinic acid mononucleotide adenylyltransferase
MQESLKTPMFEIVYRQGFVLGDEIHGTELVHPRHGIHTPGDSRRGSDIVAKEATQPPRNQCTSDPFWPRPTYRPGYTLALVKKLMADHPGHTFRLVAGQDIYHQRDKWHHYDEIAAIAPPIYVARVGEPPIPEPTVPAPPDVSSSELRKMIASRTPVDGLLPKTIVQYIEAHHLYVDASDD